MASLNLIEIKIVTHYSEDDPEFLGDYRAVSVYVNGEREIEYGDFYHDDGMQKARGFIHGATAMGEILKVDVIVKRESVADWI